MISYTPLLSQIYASNRVIIQHGIRKKEKKTVNRDEYLLLATQKITARKSILRMYFCQKIKNHRFFSKSTEISAALFQLNLLCVFKYKSSLRDIM